MPASSTKRLCLPRRDLPLCRNPGTRRTDSAGAGRLPAGHVAPHGHTNPAGAAAERRGAGGRGNDAGSAGLRGTPPVAAVRGGCPRHTGGCGAAKLVWGVMVGNFGDAELVTVSRRVSSPVSLL